MASKYLILNGGSTSRKFALVEEGRVLADAHIEFENHGPVMTAVIAGKTRTQELTGDHEANQLKYFLSQCEQKRLLTRLDNIHAVVVRVVAPGTMFAKHQIVDDAFCARLKDAEVLVPSHIPVTLRDIEEARSLLPNRPVIAASDSAFHQTIPDIARMYALEPEYAKEHDVYRFGYHGLSAMGIAMELGNDNEKHERVVVVHMGGGTSVTALHDLESVETTMGFLPISGISMPTRVGDLDSGAMAHLIRSGGEDLPTLIKRLYSESGLTRFAGIGEGGFKEILLASKLGNPPATKALAKFGYQVRGAVARSAAALGGVDTVVLTGTAALRSPSLRYLALGGLGFLGLEVDHDLNNETVEKEGRISKAEGVEIRVVKSKEVEAMIQVANDLHTYPSAAYGGK